MHLDYFSDYVKLLDSQAEPILQLTCNFHVDQVLSKVSTEGMGDWKCRFCNNASDVNSIGSFFKEISKSMFDKDEAFMCPNDEELICKYCAFLAVPEDINYMDVTGKSYMSFKPPKVKETKCSNGHVVEHIRQNPFETISLKCDDCGKNFLFS